MSASRRFFVIIVLLCSLLMPAGAQEEPHPLLAMLARVPNIPLTRTDIYYVDWRAIEAAYPPALMPPSYASFDGIGRDIPGVQLWWLIFRNAQSQIAQQMFGVGQEAPSTVGFDIFQIERELAYGRPPENALQLEGNFDLQAVRMAFENLGFAQEARNDAELWCSTDGCDKGRNVNPAERQLANPFGGQLGRKQPLLIGDGVLISSPSAEIIELHILAANGEALTLADVPQYRAAIATAIARGVLLQAYFLDGEILSAVLAPPPNPRDLSATPETPPADYEPLPAYQFVLMADLVSETEQIGFFGFVYGNEESARKAADLLPQRIANYNSALARRPMSALLEERYITVRTDVSQHEETGLWVTALEWFSPKATTEEIFALTDLSGSERAAIEKTTPGLIYRTMMQQVFQFDMGWLAAQ